MSGGWQPTGTLSFASGSARAGRESRRLRWTACAPSRARITEHQEPGEVDLAAVRSGDVVLVVDDDDLVRPDFLEHMRLARETGLWNRPIVWPDGKHGWHGGGSLSLLPRVLERPVLRERLGYRGPYFAIPGRLLRENPNILRVAWTHQGIVDYFQREEPLYRAVSTPQTVIVKHPCSVTVLRHVHTESRGDHVGARLRSLVEQYVQQPIDLQPNFQWATEDLLKIRAVFAQALGK